jgi:enamine deaminase RidA (YjgF/YER057c/UK114 family)
MEKTCFDPPGARSPGFSQALAAGPWIFVSGQVPIEGGRLVGAGDPAKQARQCFANISATLALAGAGLPDVVKLTCYLVDPAAYPAYAEVKAALFPEQPPAGTAVVIAGLLIPGALFEVEATALRSDPRG